MNHSAFSARRPFGRREGGLCPLSFSLSTTFFQSRRISSGGVVSSCMQFFVRTKEVYAPFRSSCQSLFFAFPKIFSKQRVKVIMQFFMSAEEAYTPLCPDCQSLFSLSRKFPASQVKVIIQFCMSEGDLCSSFRTPSITFFDSAKLCFACVPF